MERDVLMRKTVRNIERLSTGRIQEVNNFVEFMLRKSNNALIIEDLQQLSSESHTYDFLSNEPELYSVNDLKVKFT